LDSNGASDRRSEHSNLSADIPFLRERVRAAGMPERALAVAEHELTRLEYISPESSEYSLSRSYFDWLLSLPWNDRTEDESDINRTLDVLDKGHFGLEHAKAQIADHLAVMQLRQDGRGPVLCLVGSHGTGKTSLGHSIARALGRKFVRISVRGATNESEINGQRRTWRNALPGKIIRGLRSAGVRNPVFMIEDVDRMGASGQGDVRAALIEAIDPKLRGQFADHYMDVTFDLSEVLFVATARLQEAIPESISGAMDQIILPGYVQEEKYQIARHFLLPKERDRCGLSESQFELDEPSLRQLSRSNPEQAGLHSLSMQIGGLARKAAGVVARGTEAGLHLDASNLSEWIDATAPQDEPTGSLPDVGTARALVIAPRGAGVMNVEVTRITGRSNLTVTGPQSEQLRGMVEMAVTLLRACASRYDINSDLFDNTHLHVHVEQKLAESDLDSMGMAILAALVSEFTGKPIRHDVAISGGISLRGHLRSVPRMVDKILAARRLEIAHIVMPRANAGDLDRIPGYVREALSIHAVDTADEALDRSLQQIIVPKPEETSAIELALSESGNVPPNTATG
jgi:ATP-dependent Lon protease